MSSGRSTGQGTLAPPTGSPMRTEARRTVADRIVTGHRDRLTLARIQVDLREADGTQDSTWRRAFMAIQLRNLGASR